MKKIGMVIGVLVLAVSATADVIWTGDVEIGVGVTEADEHNSGDSTSNINSLNVGRNTNGDGTLDVSGGTLNVANGGLFVGNYNNAVGVLNVNGGDMTVAQANNFIGDNTTGGGEINLSSGSLTFSGQGSIWMGNSAGIADIKISGGEWSGGKLLMNLGGTSGLSVTGDDATSIWFNDSSIGSGINTFNLTADASGITLIDFNAVSFAEAGTQILNIDISAYDTVANDDSLTLIDSQWSTFAASDFDTINIIGGTGDVNVTADGFGSVMTIDNIVPVPEPATIGLLGIGTLLTLLVRRFRM